MFCIRREKCQEVYLFNRRPVGLFFSLSYQRGKFLIMAPPSVLMLLMVVAVVTGARAASEENELDYGYWNYREGGKSRASFDYLTL